NLGITFKENCPDVRNTKAADVVTNLESFSLEVITYDPWANPEEVEIEYNIKFTTSLSNIAETRFDAIILTVAHQEFLNLDLSRFLNDNGVIYDVKGILENFDRRL
ncbi:UDP binding domain-containing protein, partial [uncultured Chryseobacterium sp.]|uniref:UDP binding domain-containing protein n=1 Tax=uncultured Chryseobacterium sp. TaxID=259322 RepID=UPI002623D868